MSWKERCKLLRKINNNSHYIFVDESGSVGGIKKLQKKIIENQRYDIRNEAIFMLNSILIDGNKFNNALYYINKIKKKTFNNTEVIFHSSDIYSKKGVFVNLTDNKTAFEFYEDTTKFIAKTQFIQLATAIKKDEYIKENIKKDVETTDEDIFKYIYSTHLIKIALMLKGMNKNAILVFESVNKDIDRQILELVIKIKNSGTTSYPKKDFKYIKAVYFVQKTSSSYSPFGEIVDLTCRPVYNHFSNIEYQSLLPKFYNYPHDIVRNSISMLRKPNNKPEPNNHVEQQVLDLGDGFN